MPIKSGFYKGRLGIGLDTTDSAYTSGSDTGIPLYPLDINGDIRITGCIVNKQGNSINLSTSIMQLMDTDTNLSKIDATVDFNILSTGHLKLPSGTTAQRTATGVLGMLRYNTTTSSFEGYGAGNAWGSLGGVMDIDQDTYITAEQSSDEDKLRFYVGGNEKMLIQNTTNDGIIIKSSIIPDTDSTFDIGSASKKIRHMYISSNSLWVGDDHRISIDNDGTLKFKKRNKNVVPKGLRDALNLDSTASIDKVKADLGVADISTLKLEDWLNYTRNHATGMANADIKDIFKNEDNEDYEQIDGTVTTVGELNQITNVNTDTKAQGQPLVWNGGTWSASSDIYIYNGKVGIGTTSPSKKLHVNGDVLFHQTYVTKLINHLSSGTGIWYDYANIQRFIINNQEKMRIHSNGNVGIGTTNPLAKLNVVGNVVFGTYGPSNIITHTDAQLTLHGAHNAEYNTNNKVKLLFAGADNDGGAPYDMMSEDENGVETFWLKGPTSQDGTDGVLYMKGRIGIGTTTPSTLLVVGEDGGGNATNVPGIHMKSISPIGVGNNKCYVVGQDSTHNVFLTYYATPNVADGYGALSCYSGSNNLALQRDGGNVGIGTTSPTEILDVVGNIKASGNVTAHTVTAQNYAVGSVNFISASRQGNFRDLEVKDSNNAATILLTGDGGDISIDGTLSTDTISEKTSAAGVTIDSVLLKDNTVTAHTVTASNYAVGGTNFISASRQGNFRDLEVKNSGNTATILLTGDGGDISIDGTLSVDTISEKTSAAGVTIDSVLLKDNTVTATKFIGDGSELTGVATSGGGGFNWTAQDGTKNISDMDLYHGYQITASNYNGWYIPENAFRGDSGYDGGPTHAAWVTENTKYNTSGVQTGNVDTSGYKGEWIQINFGKKVKVYHFGMRSFEGNTAAYNNRSPSKYKLFGSNDGSTWTDVHTGSAVASDYGTRFQLQNRETLSTPATYQYFRLVVNETLGNGGGHLTLEYLAFYGAFPEQVDKVAVVSGTNMVNTTYSTQTILTAPNSLPGVNISGLNLVITPTAHDSVIELKFNLWNETSENTIFRITRNINGTDVLVVPATDIWEGGISVHHHDANDGTTPQVTRVRWYDEPNTTSAVTYKLWVNSADTNGNQTIWVNRCEDSTGASNQESGVSTGAAIEHPKPQQSLTTITNATQVEGQVLETLAGVCDGRTVAVSSGSYTFPTTTSTGQFFDDGVSNVDVEGSNISYKPPSGTKQVIFKFFCNIAGYEYNNYTNSNSLIASFQGYLDDTALNFKFTESHHGGSSDTTCAIEMIFEIGGVNDIANGKLTSWDTLKTISLKASCWNHAPRSFTLHVLGIFGSTDYHSNTNPPHVPPRIEIQAIGTAQYDVVQRVVNYKDGQVLETLAGVCDGRTVAVSSGSYTLPSVAASMQLTSSYQDIPGSKISYKPPVGTTTIIFNFNALMGYVGAADVHPISHWKLYVDSVEITSFRRSIAAEHMEVPTDIKYIFAVGGVNDVANGKFSAWDTQKEIKLMAREYGTHWEVKLFETFHWDAVEANNFVTPFLEIEAIGRAIAPVGNFKIQDVDTITTPPTDGQALVWDNTNKHWKAGAGGGGGGGVQTLSSQPTIANSTPGELYYDTSWKTFFGRMESKWMEMMLEGTPLIFGHPSKIIPKSGSAIVETTATTIEFTWVNPPQYRSCMSAKDTGDYVDAINATNHTSGELYLPAINDIWFQYASNTYKVGGKNISAAVSGNKLQSLSNISGPKKLTNKVVIITTGSSVPSYASSWTPSTSANGDHYIGLDDNGNQTFIFNPNNTTWSLTAATNYNFKVWLENSTPDSLPPSVSHDSTSTADGTSNLVDTRNFSNHDGISTLEILPPTQIYVANNKLTNGFHVTLTRNGNTHYLTCIVPPEALTGTYNGTDDVKVTTTGDINAMDPVVYYKGFEVQYQTAVASDNFDKATSAIVWTGNWTNAVFSSSSTTNQTGTTFSTDADATNRIASFTPLKPTSIIVASGAGTTPTKNDFTVKKSFTLVQNDNKFYKFRVRAFNQVQINVSDSVWSEKEYVIRFNKPQTVTWKGTAAPHLPLFTTKPAQKLHWYITLNWNQQNIKSSVATGNDGTIDEYAHSDLKIHEYKLQRSQDGDTTWETVAYWTLPDDNAQLETYDYRIQPPHDDRGETETSNDGNNTKTQEARLLAGTRAPQYTFKLQARNWLFGTGIDTGSVPGPRTNYQWARASVTDNRWSAESVSSKTTYSTALIPVAPPKPVIHDNSDDKYAIKFYEMNTTDTKSPWKDGRIASHTDFNAIVDSSLIAARTKEATLQNETPDQDYISYQWKLPYPSEAFKDTLGSSVDRYEIVLEGSSSAYHTQEIYANDFNYGAANWYLQEYTTNTLLDQPLNYKVKGYNFFVTNPSDYSDPLGTALTSDKPSAPQFLSTASDANKDNSNPTFTLTNDGLTLLVDEPQYTSVDANGNANNFQLESLTIQEFQIQPNIDNSDADKTLVQDHANTKRGLNLPLEFPAGSTFHTSQAAVHTLDPGDNVWMYLADGTLVAKLTIKQDVQNGWNFEPYNNQEVGSGYNGYLSLSMDRLKASVEYVGGVWPTGLSSQASVWLKYTDDNGLGGGEVGWYLRSQPATNKLVSQGKDVVASFFHPVTGTTALDEMTGGVVKYKVKAKNVLNSTFSDEAEATLTIGKPNPGTNFKYSPRFTWVQATNKIKLEFCRKWEVSSPFGTAILDILFDGSSSTNAPISAVTANCNVTNEIKKLKWNVKCSGATGGTITTSYADVGDTTGYIDSGDNSSSTAAYTISDTGVEHWAKGTDHHVRYRVKNQYHADWFEDPAGSLYCQIKLTAPNTIGGISSVVTYAFASGNNNQLQINWTKPTQYGLHYKHLGDGSIVAQGNQPNIKTYKVYFNDGTLYYVFTRTATNQADVSDDATITSGSTVEKWTNSSRNSGYEASYSIRIKAGKTYVVEKITAINWLYDYESPAQGSSTSTTYSNGNPNYPPINGSTTITSSNAPIPTPFSNYANQGILIASGSTVRTVKKMGATNDGTALTNVLLNAVASADTSSTMGIKILVSGDMNGNSSECKFNSNGIVSGDSLTLTYSYSSTTINMATITVGSYSDLYNSATSSTDNLGYWFTNSSIKLKWHADFTNIDPFYGYNLTFSVVVTYYGSSNTVITRQIETGYYDKTIANPSVTTITPAYTPYTCCGLPILHSTDTLTVATVFNNQSTTWVASSAVNTITLGGSVASVTTSKSNHTYSGSTVSLAATDMGSYSGASLVKNAQITVVAKNCNGTASSTNSSKYIYDPKTLDLITTIANDGAIGNIHGTVSQKTGTFTVSNMICCQVPKNFNPNKSGQYCNATTGVWNDGKLDVTHADSNIATTGVNRLIMFDGKFCSDAYFRSASGFGTVSTNYDGGVASFLSKVDESEGTYTSYFNSANADLAAMEDNYRWQIFCYGWKYTGDASGFVQAVSFKLGTGTDHNIVYTDFYNASDASKPSDGGPPGSNVEIWTKVAGMGYEGRWNNATAANVTYQGDSGGNLSDLGKNSTNAWCSAVTKGWLTSDGKNTLSGGAATTDEINIAASKAPYSASGSDLFYIYVAIGLKNDVSRYITIPTTNNKLYNTGYTNTPG